MLTMRVWVPLLMTAMTYVVFGANASVGEHPARPASLLQKGQLTACVYTGFEPVLYRTSQGFAGTDIAFLQSFAAREGLTLHYKEVPFEGMWLRPGRDECDIAAAGITHTDGRDSPGVAWSEAYFKVKRSLLIRTSDRARFASFADFSGRRIGFVEGSSAQFDLEARPSPKTIQVSYKTTADGLRDLLNGQLDAFAAGDVSTTFIIQKRPELAVLDIHRPSETERIAFPTRSASGIVQRLNDYISEGASEVPTAKYLPNGR